MSARQCRQAGWFSLRGGCLLFGLALLLAGARPGAAEGAGSPIALTLFPNRVLGGQPSLGQVTLAGPGTAAGPGGVRVALASSSPAAAKVPDAVTLLPGAAAASFPITTFAVSGPTSVTITAASALGAATATLQVVPLSSPASGVRLLVSSHNTNSVLRFDGQSGALLDPFIPSGSGGLEGPHGLAIGPDGNLYVANRFHRSVLRFDGRTGAFIDAFVPFGSGGLDVPIGLAFGPDGNLYVSSYGTDQVLRYDGRTGAFLGAFVPARYAGLSAPYALLFGPDGSLYVCSQGADSIDRFDGRTGSVLGPFVPPDSGGLNGPDGLAFGPDGDLYVSSWQTHSVLRYDGASGAFRGAFVPPRAGGLTEPWDLKFGPDGNLYVASAGSDQVLRYDGRTGAFLGPFISGSGLSRPDWLLFVPAPPAPAPPLPPPTDLTARVLPGPGYPPAEWVQLSWQENSTDESAVAVWRRTEATDWTRIAVLPPHATSYLDPYLSPGVIYTYRVRATRGDVASAWSNEASALALFLHGLLYVPSSPGETLTAVFNRPDGGSTVHPYDGLVLLHVTGVGQAYANIYNDAFYLFTGPFNPPRNGHDGGYYQLAFGTGPLGAFDLGNNARNFLVGPLPPYNPAHDYTFVLDTRLSFPRFLYFGVSNGGFSDNTGAYTLAVTQLAPLR